jgi:hypothetical protein
MYETLCGGCGMRETFFRTVSERDNLPLCEICQGKIERILSAPMVITEIAPYQSPGTNKWITSRAEQREDLKRSGARLYEPGMKEDIARNKEAVAERAFAPLAAAIDQTVTNLVNTGKLENA